MYSLLTICLYRLTKHWWDEDCRSKAQLQIWGGHRWESKYLGQSPCTKYFRSYACCFVDASCAWCARTFEAFAAKPTAIPCGIDCSLKTCNALQHWIPSSRLRIGCDFAHVFGRFTCLVDDASPPRQAISLKESASQAMVHSTSWSTVSSWYI